MLREDVTDAIRSAVFDELAAVGYGRMSIEGIARRAGVGKAAVYRRWRSKLPLVLDTVSAEEFAKTLEEQEANRVKYGNK